MAKETECQTPGAVYSTSIERERISVSVDLPVPIYLDEDDAIALEANLHNAMELVMARYWQRASRLKG